MRWSKGRLHIYFVFFHLKPCDIIENKNTEYIERQKALYHNLNLQYPPRLNINQYLSIWRKKIRKFEVNKKKNCATLVPCVWGGGVGKGEILASVWIYNMRVCLCLYKIVYRKKLMKKLTLYGHYFRQLLVL